MATLHDDHDHRLHEGASLSAAAKATLQKAGERWTDMRAQIFEILADFDRAASAYEIAERASEVRGKTMAANSVYRILDLFVTNNIAKRIETANAYIVNAHPGCVHDCIFLICEKCGGVTHVDDDRLSSGVRATASDRAFITRRPVIEVIGLCSDCQR